MNKQKGKSVAVVVNRIGRTFGVLGFSFARIRIRTKKYAGKTTVTLFSASCWIMKTSGAYGLNSIHTSISRTRPFSVKPY